MSLQITAQANRRNRLSRSLPYPTTQHNSDSTTATAQQRQHNSEKEHEHDTKLTATTYILYFQPKYRTTQATLLCTYQCYSISDCLLVDLLSCICSYCSYILPVYTDRTKYIISCRLRLPYQYALVHYITLLYSTFISCKYRTVRYVYSCGPTVPACYPLYRLVTRSIPLQYPHAGLCMYCSCIQYIIS
jgi:hypothetical protein